MTTTTEMDSGQLSQEQRQGGLLEWLLENSRCLRDGMHDCHRKPKAWGEVKNIPLSLVPLSAAAAAKLPQSCLTLCDPIDSSPLGSSVPGILQASILEWVAISFSNAWKWKVKMKSLSGAQLLATPWTGAYQAPPSMGFSRQEYWSGVPLPSPVPLSECLFMASLTLATNLLYFFYLLECDN